MQRKRNELVSIGEGIWTHLDSVHIVRMGIPGSTLRATDQKIEGLDQPGPETHSHVEFERHPQFKLFDLRLELFDLRFEVGDVGLGGDVLADRRAERDNDGFGQPLVCARILDPLHRRVRIEG